MKIIKNPINIALTALIMFSVYCLFGFFVAVFPWYTQVVPYRVVEKLYFPGEFVKVWFERDAKISMTGTANIELIRIKGDIQQEIFSFRKFVEMNAGKHLNVDLS